MAKLSQYGKEWAAEYLGFDVNDSEAWSAVQKILDTVNYKWKVLPLVCKGKNLTEVYEELGMSYHTARAKLQREALICRRILKSITIGPEMHLLSESTMNSLINVGVSSLRELEYWKVQEIIDKVGEKGLKEILQVCAEEDIPIRDAGKLEVEEVPAKVNIISMETRLDDTDVSDWVKAQMRFLSIPRVSSLCEYDEETLRREGFLNDEEIDQLKKLLKSANRRFKENGWHLNVTGDLNQKMKHLEEMGDRVRKYPEFRDINDYNVLDFIKHFCREKYPELYLYAGGADKDTISRRDGISIEEVDKRIDEGIVFIKKRLCDSACVKYDPELDKDGGEDSSLDGALDRLSNL